MASSDLHVYLANFINDKSERDKFDNKKRFLIFRSIDWQWKELLLFCFQNEKKVKIYIEIESKKNYMWVTGLYEARTTPTHTSDNFQCLNFFSWMSWIQTVNFFSVFVEEFSFSFSPCFFLFDDNFHGLFPLSLTTQWWCF